MATVSDGKWTIIDGVPYKEESNHDNSVEPSDELRRRFRKAECKETLLLGIGIISFIFIPALPFFILGTIDILGRL